jgi:hypothetical protein
MDKSPFCYNCHHELSEKDIFCPQCGQKGDEHILTVKELLSNFWSSIYNLDGTVFKTIRYIWAPWKLTQFYVSGKRKSFLNPMRVFLITLLFHFGYLVQLTNIENKDLMQSTVYTDLEKSKLYDNYLSVKKDFVMEKQTKSFADSIELKLFSRIRTPQSDTFFITKILNSKKYAITKKDAVELPIDSFFEKYKITSFKEKILLKQVIRMNLDRTGTIKYAIGNAAWGVLVAIILLALFFKILYFRKKLHFVEHLVFWMNLHSFYFILLSISLYISTNTAILANSGLIIFISLAIPIYLFVNMLMYYKDSKRLTFVKFIFTTFFYLMVGFTVISLVGVGSLLFF